MAERTDKAGNSIATYDEYDAGSNQPHHFAVIQHADRSITFKENNVDVKSPIHQGTTHIENSQTTHNADDSEVVVSNGSAKLT